MLSLLTFILEVPFLPRVHAQRGKVIGSSSLSLSSSARKSPDPEFWANLRVLLVVKVSEIERKRAYVRQGCPKGTTKAINRASCLVTPISHTHSNSLHMHAPYFERSRKRTSTLAIDRMMAT